MPSRLIIVQYLGLFHELYPTRELTDLTAEAWQVALADVGDGNFEWAARRLLTEPGRTYFPTPNEIRQQLGSQQPHQRRLTGVREDQDTVDRAVDEWYAGDGARRYAEANRARNAELEKKFPHTWGNRGKTA